MTKYDHTVLLIDDDEKLGALLANYFAKFKIKVLSEVLPSAGIETLKRDKPELIILDIMLPEMDGFEVCRKIRQFSNIPIIMLTARGDVDDRVVGLTTGADDYLPKPFEPRELVVRIENMLTRIEDAPNFTEENLLKLGELSINQNSHEVKVQDKPIDLTAKEYALLTLMVGSPRKIFSRDDIMNELSGIDSELFSRSVDILVSRLRNKLKPLDYIETVWGQGYRFDDK